MCRVLLSLRWRVALVSLAALLCAPCSGAAADAPSAALPETHRAWCPVYASVTLLDRDASTYAIGLGALETQTVSGTVAFYSGDHRYDVPFRNAIAMAPHDLTSTTTPIVLRFPGGTVLEGAAVTALGAPDAETCDAHFNPWKANPPKSEDMRSPAERQRDANFLERARASTPADAPPAVVDTRTCDAPDRWPRTVYAKEPTMPTIAMQMGVGGTALVGVLLKPDSSIAGTWIDRSSGDARLDSSALSATNASRFQVETFRCRPVVGVYIFSVSFVPR